MKRLVTFTLSLMTAVLLGACSAGGKDKTASDNRLDESFGAAVSVNLDKLSAQGNIRRYGDGMWEVEFTSPNTLSGVMLEFAEGNVKASYKGLNFSVPQSAMPVKAMLSNLITAVDTNARSESLSGEEKDGSVVISGSLEGGDYELTVDSEGNLSGFSMPANKLEMKFTEVTSIDSNDSQQSATEAPSENTQAPTEGSADASVITPSENNNNQE